MVSVVAKDFVNFVKTNIDKELAPYDEDWFNIRCASVAEHINIRSSVGVNTVRKIYDVRNGSCSSHCSRGSGTVARRALQILEELKLVTKDDMDAEIWTALPLNQESQI
ncbi:40S ribosomal protein S19 [Caligus rogercresseyi]|uniref:40S ribosomal protein S19 n=1 Tax=Caligus rogercresseyi TaxID=217165 RepID=A0A7T8GQY2_CALRO|nr:40S ribosomal protein S19 [Caligus rogercresseyi]